MSTTGSFTLTSSAFTEGGSIPRKYTCDAENVSPPLAWSNPPSGTAAYALIVDDPDARGFVHWVAFNIPGNTTQLAEGAKGAEAGTQGRTSFGRAGYGGPCPPSGTHHYVFQLLALSKQLSLSGAPTADEVRSAARSVTLGEAKLTGTYRRGG
jgi:Raf kinase inhibitor-like YbhB/YbcL family protein